MSGNRLHHRGLYEEAAAAYLSVAPTTFGPSASAVLSFDLANVYARLGEGAAASELYARVRKTGLASLSASAWYNEGLLLYEKGRYAEAYRAFRSALELNPGDEDARWNLELAWRDFQRKSALPPERAAPSQRGSGGSSDQELRLLRRLETGRFIPGVQAEPLVLPDDY
jgi:tetratricopeptide (TPR) repeat protein